MFLFSKKREVEPDIVVDIEPMEEKEVDVETRVIISEAVEEAVRDDDMAKDLAYLVGDAITVWANKYSLQNLPRDIILDQAISILTAVKDAMR